MWTLLIRLCGPMQSWGVASQFDQRDTEHEPSKSGTLGLICAALGIPRENWTDLEPYTRCRMGVRIDKAGSPRTDYQTAQLQPWRDDSKTTQTWKAYLADADFLVGLESPQSALLCRAHEALKNPRWPLSLGRKAFLPTRPVWVKEGLRDEPLEQALRWDWPANTRSLRVALETEQEGAIRNDQPVGPFSERLFAPRRVKYIQMEASTGVPVATDSQP